MSEVAAWKQFANNMFAAFGDVVKDATVSVISETSTYDDQTGQMVKGSTNTATKLIWSKGKSKFDDIESFKAGDLVAMIRGSDFSTTPSIGSTVTVDSQLWRIMQIAEEDMGVGSVYLLHLRKQGQRSATS